jgi:hypothetical protein
MIASSYTGQVQNLVTFGWWCIKPKVKLQHAHEELTAGFCMCVLACIALQHVCCLEPDCMCAKKLNLNLNLNVTDLHANIDQLQSLSMCTESESESAFNILNLVELLLASKLKRTWKLVWKKEPREWTK